MQVLLIGTETEDYLQDSIIHGFKELIGEAAIEYPIQNKLYADFKMFSSIRGNGFTLYGLLNTELKPGQTPDLITLLKNVDFDRIIFTCIHRQYQVFYQLYPLLRNKSSKVWLLDGEDTEVMFPFLLRYLKTANFWLKKKPHKRFKYFKRELTINTIKGFYFRLIPFSLAKKIKLDSNIYPIAFSIPKEKIAKNVIQKTKLFASHIVDSEVSGRLGNTHTNYVFDKEEDYYHDIQQSKFGITTKRGGWDCLRHYELAANRAVLCFKDLDLKPKTCAPHGLVPGYNCISYKNYDDLMLTINKLSEPEYLEILAQSLNWINENTTINRVKKMLEDH